MASNNTPLGSMSGPSCLPTLSFPEELARHINLPDIQNQVNLMVHSQLVKAIIEEKLKNEILLNALLRNLQPPGFGSPQPPAEPVGKQEPKECGTASNSSNLAAPEASKSESDEDSEVASCDLRSRKCQPIRKLKNETKNIPKNFGKAIVSFIEKQERLTQAVVSRFPGLDYAQFILEMRQRRRRINSIADLRALWLEAENRFAQPTRILSLIFLKKHSLPYIFHSRVTNYEGHIKYRYRLMEALKDPKNFTSIKSF